MMSMVDEQGDVRRYFRTMAELAPANLSGVECENRQFLLGEEGILGLVYQLQLVGKL